MRARKNDFLIWIIWIGLLLIIVNTVDIDDSISKTASSTPTTDVYGTRIPHYDREADFGTWTTEGGTCENTRAKVLISQSLMNVKLSNDGCTVVSGKWIDPWSGKVTTDAHSLDIDHLVPLANAWVSGAANWDSQKRTAFANNLDDADMLLAIPSDENRDKSDAGPDEWKPKAKSSWCRYATAWVTIKNKWGLAMKKAEAEAVKSMLSKC